MPKISSRTLRRAVAALLSAQLATAPAWAQTSVTNLSDLMNQSSDYSQREMPRRGYVFVHADPRGSKTWEYWWKPGDSVCARVAHVDGRATSIVGASPTDCNQYAQQQPQPSPSGGSKGMSDGAKVALGAAALLGVAMLAHRSHERDEAKHANEQQVAEYERGYRDGLYHQPYHDYSRSQSYVDGYHAGQQKRAAETSYRSPSGYHSGQASYVAVNDLIGARGSSMDDAFRQRGFVQKGGYQSQGQAVSMWWNVNTRQCLSVIVSDGRVQNISPIVEGNCL